MSRQKEKTSDKTTTHLQTENIIKHIIREIGEQCKQKGLTNISESLIAFIVKAVAIDPTNQFDRDKVLNKDDVEKLVKLCLKKLETASPSTDTLKMQVYFDMNYAKRDEYLREHAHVKSMRLQPLIRDITDSRARSREELEQLYVRIVNTIMVMSGLGNPTDITATREATAALQTIFPHQQLGAFLPLNKPDKEQQLVEMSQVVTGIRLFNKECGRGGEGIDDLVMILNEQIPTLMDMLDRSIANSTQRAVHCTALLETMQSDTNLRDAQFNFRQHQLVLEDILGDVILVARQTEALTKKLESCVNNLQQTVQLHTAVSTSRVYPMFIDLSKLWTGFQDEVILLSMYSSITGVLQEFTKSAHSLYPDKWLEEKTQGMEVFSDVARRKAMLEKRDYAIDPEDFPDRDILFPADMKLPVRFQYSGFCCWSVVALNQLIKGIADIGVLHYNNCYYAFASKEAAYEFAQNPDYFILEMANLAKSSPELIQLLQLQQQFASAADTPSYIRSAGPLFRTKLTHEMGVQTPTHFVLTNIVKDYEWNEWELRRKALKLANLRNKLTQSSQTIKSHKRSEKSTQVYPPKENSCQTRLDGYTNIPQPRNYMQGLRQHGTGKKYIVDLTRPLDET